MLPSCLPNGAANPQAMCFARLYLDEVMDYFTCHPHRIQDFDIYISGCASSASAGDIAKLVVQDGSAFLEFIGKISDDNVLLLRQIQLSDVLPESNVYAEFCKKFLYTEDPEEKVFVLDRVAKRLRVSSLQRNLLQLRWYDEVRKCADEVTEAESELENEQMARRFLRSLPLIKESNINWFNELVDACKKDAINASFIVPILEPLCHPILDTACRPATSSNPFDLSALSAVLDAGVSCRPPSHFLRYRAEPSRGTAAVLPELRSYQEELVARGAVGENTIVCAPTGSGKTVVAAFFAISHLLQKKHNDQPARVVMVVPKVLLVKQQAELLSKYANGEFFTVQLCGDVNVSGEAQLKTALSADILVLTPQILVNMLTAEEESSRIFPVDISLLLLDECHHTDKKNPYHQIMLLIRESKQAKPQVIGLTASLGVGENRICAEGQASAHILSLCLRLSAQSLSTVQKHVNELKKFVGRPVEVPHKAEKLPLPFRPFSTRIRECVLFTQQQLCQEVQHLMTRPSSGCALSPSLLLFPDIEEEFQPYINRISELDRVAHMMNESESKWFLKRAVDFLKIYQNAILINTFLPASFALEQMKKDVDLIERNTERTCAFLAKFREQCPGFQKDFVSEEDKDVLRMLRKELRDQFSVNGESRVLVFCERREIAQLLSRYMTEQRIFPGRAEVLVSSNAAGSLNGQTSSDQKAVIEAFRRGDIKVLAVTSVAEEGLDVAECNLIIKYNVAGSVVQLVQRRGRARAKNSRSVLLAVSNTVYSKERENQASEEIMQKVVQQMNDMGVHEFRRKLAEQEKLELEGKSGAEIDCRASCGRVNSDEEYTLLCHKCNCFLCSSKSLRVEIGHIVCVDDTFWRRVKTIGDKQNNGAPSAPHQLVLCKCGAKVATLVFLKSVHLPAIRPEAVAFQSVYGLLLPRQKKWSSVTSQLFRILDCLPADRDRMNAAWKEKISREQGRILDFL